MARQLLLIDSPFCTVHDCCAPLCPRDRHSLVNSVWYPGEPVCAVKPAREWVKVQKRIARTPSQRDRIFSARMLKNMANAGLQRDGIDPEQPELVHTCRVTGERPVAPQQPRSLEAVQASLW